MPQKDFTFIMNKLSQIGVSVLSFIYISERIVASLSGNSSVEVTLLSSFAEATFVSGLYN